MIAIEAKLLKLILLKSRQSGISSNKLSLIIQTLFLAMVIHFSINPEGKDIYGNQGG